MFWKIYFWIVLANVILQHVVLGFPRAWEFIDLVFNTIAIIGLFGFCWERAIFRRCFWKVFMLFFAVWILVYEFMIPLPQNEAEISPPMWYMATGISLIWTMIILWIIALYLYSFRNSDLWE